MNRLPDEHDMDQVVRSWMREEGERPADRNRQVGRIMGRVDETRQRHGAWRFLPFGRETKRTDEHDDELFVARGGAVAMRRGVSSAMAVAAVAVLIVIGAALIALLPRVPETGPGAQPAVHAEDRELMTAFAGLWSGEGASLADVVEVYDTEAVRTTLWHDTVERLEGPDEIWKHIQDSPSVGPSAWIPLPDEDTGDRRYMSATGNVGETVCVAWVGDGRITRHDCILPMASTDGVPEWEPPAADTLKTREALWIDFTRGFSYKDLELIEATVSPEIVHHVAHDQYTTMRTGISKYQNVMGLGEPEEWAPPIPLPAPAGEHRWSDYSDVGGGTLCTFWERDALIIRHDCIVSTFVLPLE